MNTFYTTLRPLILTKLGTITGLQSSYNFHTEKVTGYPCATFEPSSSKSDYFTNVDNLREYAFDVIVWQEMFTAGRSDAIDNLCKVADAVIDAFESDTTLTGSGGIHYLRPVNTQWGEVAAQAGPVKFFKFTLVCGVEATPASS